MVELTVLPEEVADQPEPLHCRDSADITHGTQGSQTSLLFVSALPDPAKLLSKYALASIDPRGDADQKEPSYLQEDDGREC